MNIAKIITKLSEELLYVTDEELTFLAENLRGYVNEQRRNYTSGTIPKKSNSSTRNTEKLVEFIEVIASGQLYFPTEDGVRNAHQEADRVLKEYT